MARVFLYFIVLLFSLVYALKPRVEVILFGPYSSLADKFLWDSLIRMHQALGSRAKLAVYGCSLANEDTALGKIRAIINRPNCDTDSCLKSKAALSSSITYVQVASDEGFMRLGQALNNASSLAASDEYLAGRVVYLAVDTQLAPGISKSLAIHAGVRAGGPADPDAGARATYLVLEKPIGRDSVTSGALLTAVAEHAHPDGTFIVDHYLAKPGLHAVAVIRERLAAAAAAATAQGTVDAWHPTALQGAILEMEDLAGRTTFFGRYGITRDVMQSHLTQLVAAAIPSSAAGGPNSSSSASSALASRLSALRSLSSRSGAPLRASDRVGVYDGYTQEAVQEARGGPVAPVATAARHTLSSTSRGVGAPLLPVELAAGKALGVRSCFLRFWLGGEGEGEREGGGAASVTVHVQGTLVPPPGTPDSALTPLLAAAAAPAVLIVQPGGGPAQGDLEDALLGRGAPGAPLWPWGWDVQRGEGAGADGRPVRVVLAVARRQQPSSRPTGSPQEEEEEGQGQGQAAALGVDAASAAPLVSEEDRRRLLRGLLAPVLAAETRPGSDSAAAYASLLAAAAIGDGGAFTSPEEVRELWRVWGPALEAEDAALAALSAGGGADQQQLLLPVRSYAKREHRWLLEGDLA